ncbi:unnamed protein product [marine sediment metagenome]|uniref:Uncharacterized protein n=1 Tax=marine sediment metagenome TaxID=412755 RepID=X0S830_9ZZZZ
MLKRIKKLLNKIKGFLPMRRKQFEKFVKDVLVVIDGLITTDKQHTQIEAGLIKEIGELKDKAKKPEEIKPISENDINYQ